MDDGERPEPSDYYRPRVVVNVKKSALPAAPSSSKKRRKYETAEDIEHERAFFKHVGATSQFTARKIKRKLYPVDGVIERGGRIVAIVEFKRRIGVFAYDNIFLSLQKLVWMQSTKTAGIDSFFVLEAEPGQYFAADVTAGRYALSLGGRTGRNDEQDEEPIARIPKAEFKPLRSMWERLECKSEEAAN